MPSIPRICLLFLLLFTVTIPVAAQQGYVQLSPPEPVVHYSMPSDIRVQSAASLGTGTLVVWGTYETDGNGVARRMLRLQHLQAGEADRPSQIAHSDAAAPSMPIHVGAIEGGYVLYWHDRRTTAPGLYMRRFDRLGNPLEVERRVAEGEIVDLLTFPTEDGFQSLMTVYRKSLPPLLLHRNGSVETRSMPEGRLDNGHIIYSDSSLVELKEGLRYYRHFLDPNPVRVVSLDTLHAKSIVLTTDSNRRPLLNYCVSIYNGGVRAMTFNRASVADDGTIRFLDSIGGYARAPADVRWIGELVGLSQSRLGDGSIVLSVSYRWRYHPYQADPIDSYDNFVFVFGPRGTYSRVVGSLATERWGEEPVARTSSDDYSKVMVMKWNPSGTVQSQIAPTRSTTLDDSPHLVAFGDSVYLTWNRVVSAGATSLVHVVLARWPRPGQPSAQPFDTNAMRIGETRSDNDFQTSWTYWNVVAWPGGATQKHAEVVYMKKGSGTTRVGNGVRNIVATPNGWKHLDTMPMQVAGIQFHAKEWQFDPNERTLTIPVYAWYEVYNVGVPKLRLGVVDSSGATLETRALDSADGSVIPIARGERLVLKGNELLHAIGDSIDRRKPFQSAAGRYLQMSRAYGRYFVRAWLDSVDRSLHVERFTLDGAPAGTFHVPLTAGAQSLTYALNPADSSIVFLYSTLRTIRYTRLSQDLQPIAVDRIAYTSSGVVETPCGVFNGGRLFLAWVDHATGGGDIRGLIVEPSTLGIEHEVSAVAGVAMTLAPNPASDRVEVRIETREWDVVIELIDMEGRVIRSHRAERTASGVHATFDLDALPAGTYLAVARIGSTRVTRRIVKR